MCFTPFLNFLLFGYDLLSVLCGHFFDQQVGSQSPHSPCEPAHQLHRGAHFLPTCTLKGSASLGPLVPSDVSPSQSQPWFPACQPHLDCHRGMPPACPATVPSSGPGNLANFSAIQWAATTHLPTRSESQTSGGDPFHISSFVVYSLCPQVFFKVLCTHL